MEIGLYLHPLICGDWRVVSEDSAVHCFCQSFHLHEPLIRKMLFCLKALCYIHESCKGHSLALEEQWMLLKERDYFCFDISVIYNLISDLIRKCWSVVYLLGQTSAIKEIAKPTQDLTIILFQIKTEY